MGSIYYAVVMQQLRKCTTTKRVAKELIYWYCKLPSALARDPESRIYSRKVCMYVRTWWVTLRNVMRNVVNYLHAPYPGPWV